MRAVKGVLVALAVVLTAVPAMAGKVGFVDVERAVSTVGQGKVKLQELENWAKPRREALEKTRAGLVQQRDELEKQRSVASAETVAQLQQEFQTAARKFEDDGRAFNRDLQAKQDELLGGVAEQMGQVASDYGKANDFEAIFVLNAQPLIYVAEGADITDIVIRLYDEKYPVE